MRLLLNFQQSFKEIEIRGHSSASCLYLHVQAQFQIQNFMLVCKGKRILNKNEPLTQMKVTEGSKIFIIQLCKSHVVENKLQQELKAEREQYIKQFHTTYAMQDAWKFVTQINEFDNYGITIFE
ncbi:Hypothetical_protein [Hexamita inflata]|uniref:Hypothetical_protein n=1 Tax=Hexamita inflata TaxID=28002 RepID=A0AA86PNV2_9EUKA|nr:Hypothetical protein HINF_LOCUS30604 [Hexamita inflata]CAI9942961.1 Hypothetical protein HINF_LOCUS30606 [Hexamita inflata]